MESQKVPMDNVTVYRKDYNKKRYCVSEAIYSDRDYEDPMAGPFTEYLLRASKWDKDPPPDDEIYEHPDHFWRRLWAGKKSMKRFDKDSGKKETDDDDHPLCYCEKMLLHKVPGMEPPDKAIIDAEYEKRNQSTYQGEICKTGDDYWATRNVILNKKEKEKLKLPVGWELPLTSNQSFYRSPDISKQYMDISPPKNYRRDDNLTPNEKIRSILGVVTGDSEYGSKIGKLANMIIKNQMHGDVTRKEVNAYEILRQMQMTKK